jgi:epoxide hydrolase 4
MSVEIEVRHERMRGDGVTLHVARAGTGPPVILLHGFPENWTSWRHQILPLARAGFSVLAPDLRGYNLSDRPTGRDAYRLRHLVDDVAALVRGAGFERAHVVGHDWGGIIAWTFAGEHPALLDRLVVLNAPHMRLYAEAAWRPAQLFRSAYVYFFQLPALPEALLSAADFAAVRHMFRALPARRGAFTRDEIDGYVRALAGPGALKAAIDYYRANAAPGAFRPARHARTDAPVLVIWGERDPALSRTLLDGIERFAPRVRVHRLPDAGHWVQNEAPDEVNALLLQFLGEAA